MLMEIVHPFPLLRVAVAYSSIFCTVNYCRAGTMGQPSPFSILGRTQKGRNPLYRTVSVMVVFREVQKSLLLAQRRVIRGG